MKFWSFLLIISKMFLQFLHRHILLLEQCDVLFELLFWQIPPFEFLEFGDSSFLLPHHPLLNHLCWIAANNRPGFYILEDGSSGSYNGTFANGDTHTHESIGCDPSVWLYRDGSCDELLTPIADVMTGSTEVCALGDGRTILDGDNIHIVDSGIRTDVREAFHYEVSRVINFSR